VSLEKRGVQSNAKTEQAKSKTIIVPAQGLNIPVQLKFLFEGKKPEGLPQEFPKKVTLMSNGSMGCSLLTIPMRPQAAKFTQQRPDVPRHGALWRPTRGAEGHYRNERTQNARKSGHHSI
jgi:hypothetical protein